MTDAELVKSKIDIVSFLSEYITLKKAGRNYKALCPFHSERTPSFVISAERQSWHCFGACGVGGDAISFLEKWENIEFLEALKILAKKTGVTLSNYVPSETSKLKEKLYEVNHLASEFYHYLLLSHALGQRAREYLKKRHIKSETINTFTLGYAPESWDSLLNFLKKKGYSDNDIYTAGLLVKSERGTYYDRFRGRLMFTLRDHRGNIVGFSGRLLNEGVHPELARGAKYVNTSETPIYIKGDTLYGLDITREAIKEKKEAVLVEGEFDMLSSFQAGVSNVVAIKGSAVTNGQLLLLKRYTENLILALDSDFAGNEAAKRGIEAADNANITVRVAKLPFGKDPADCVEKDPHLWKRAIAEALPIYDFIIESSLSKFSKEDVLGKKKIGQEVIPFLAKISNPIVASHYVRYLSRELGVGEESIEESIRQFQKKQTISQVTPTSSKAKKQDSLEEHFLSLVIQSDDPLSSFSEAMKTLTLDDFFEPPVTKIMGELSGYFKMHKKLDIKKFSLSLAPEIIPTFDKVCLIDINHIVSNSHNYPRELNYTIKLLKKNSLRRRINNFSTKLRQAEKEDKDEETKKYSEELRQLMKEMGELDKSS